MRSCVTIGCREISNPPILQKQALYVAERADASPAYF
jgi:hypothetical protein